MLEKFYHLRRLAEAFEHTKKNIMDHVESLTTLETEAKSCEDAEELE